MKTAIQMRAPPQMPLAIVWRTVMLNLWSASSMHGVIIGKAPTVARLAINDVPNMHPMYVIKLVRKKSFFVLFE